MLAQMRCPGPLNRRIPWLLCWGWFLLLSNPVVPARGDPVLSEFLADNTLGRKDEDGDYEDWIEVHNPDSETVQLGGWHLTDTVSDPTRWTFPEVEIAPGGFLVVVASGKDRRVAGRELHTSFRLAAGGEYLALIRPDGTVASAFAPAYPSQVANVSYGPAAISGAVSLIGEEAGARLRVPPDGGWGTEWTQPEFEDGAWTPVTLGVGWDDAGGLTDLIRTEIAGSVRGRASGVYLRVPFEVDHPSALEDLTLTLRFDDGFAAFLNGHPVGQRHVPADWPGGVVADQTADWSATGEPGVNGWYYGFYDLTSDLDGAYDPASDFENLHPQWTWDGAVWALGPGNPPWTMIGARSWHPNGQSGGGNVQWAIRRWICQTTGSVRMFVAGAKENTGCGNGVTFRVLVNGRPELEETIAFNDAVGFATYLDLDDLNPGDLIDFILDPTGTDGDTADGCDGSTFAAQVVQEAFSGLTWNSAATRSRSIDEARTPETLDLRGSRDRLRVGTNVLAVHLLNAAADDSDLLLTVGVTGRVTRLDTRTLRYFTRPTPGNANAEGIDTLGPVVISVEATPTLPRVGEDLTVVARVQPTLRPVREVTLVYRVMYGAETPVPMADDGRHGDGAAGDGWWGARIPGTAAGAGQMVRWAVLAADDRGATLRSPPYPDPRRSPQYDGTVVADPSLAGSRLPVLHWFMANATAADTDAGARGSLFYDGEFYDNILANLHGQSTRGFPKKSYDFDFNPGHTFRWRRDQPRVDDFNLLTTWADKTHFRTVLAYETYAEAGAPAHFAFPVRVQLNGRFHSVANFVENGDDNFLERLGWDPRGAFYKMYNGAEDTAGAEKKTRKEEGTQDLAELIRGFTVGTTSAREAFLFDHLDVPEVVNSLAARAITGDTDCCHKNYYLYRDTQGSREWSLLPWDVDLSFGRVWTCNDPCLAYFDQTIYTNTGLYVGQNNRILGTVLNTPATRQMYLRRVRTLMDTLTQAPGVPAAEDRWRRRTLELRDWIAPDAALDLAKWGTWGRRETITQAVARLHDEFLPGRRAFLFVNRVQAKALPEAQPPDSEIRFGPLEYRTAARQAAQEYFSLTNANAMAVDLSDWQVEGAVRFRFKPGTVLPPRSAAWVSPDRPAFRSRSASPRGGERRLVLGDYEGELSSAGGTLVLRDARGRRVSEITFPGDPSPAQRQLRLTEVHYHPGETLVPPDSEFLELLNLGPSVLDLDGIAFTRGIQFRFSDGAVRVLQPGERVVLVSDPVAFAARHGLGVRVAGSYTGSLANEGERLRLEDAAGEPIFDAVYPAAAFPASEGTGFALVLADPEAPVGDGMEPGRWRVGRIPGGTPGRAEPASAPGVAVVVQEVLSRPGPSFPDAIELHNPGLAPADIGGWWLSDDRQRPQKFRIPPGTVIPAGGYVVFDEDDFNARPGEAGSFALSSRGDEVWLFSAGAAGLTGDVDGVAFPAAAAGESFGRQTNSAGVVHFPAQRGVTLGGPNAGPRVGPVVFQEVYFAAARGEIPFLELRNATASEVALHHPDDPFLTWRIAGVDYAMPPALSLPPGGLLLVVGGDPRDFRIRHAIPSFVPVLGPWNGVLRPEGERLVLERPDTPEFDSEGRPVIPWIPVDAVELRVGPPGPLAGVQDTGRSAERVASLAWGDDPANWRVSAGPPTPGTHDASNRAPVVRVGPEVMLEAEVFPQVLALSGEVDDDGQPGGTGGVVLAWTQVEGPGAAAFSAPDQARITVAVPGPGQYVFRLTAFDGDASGSGDVTVTVSRPPAARTLVSAGAVWRYSDAGREPDPAWATVGFPDAAWSSGPAPLGYGDGDEATALRSRVEGAPLLTAYFRARFVVLDPAVVTALTVRLVRDDGAAVWLNGVEAWRSNLPEGALSYATPAVATVSGADETTFFEQALSPSLLRAGTNVVAAEVHQQNPSSSDLRFDLELAGLAVPVNRAPTVSAGPSRTVTAQVPTPLAATWGDDGLPRVPVLRWEQVSGPAVAGLSAPHTAAPTVILPVPGAYRFRFSVDDGEFAVSSETTWTAVVAGDEYVAWKAVHFTPVEQADPGVAGDEADPDGDGATNLGEFRAGTDPRDAGSVFRLAGERDGEGRVRLRFPGRAGRIYAIQGTTDLVTGAWTELERVEVSADGDGEVVITDPHSAGAGGRRFYRVLTPAP